jgi:hypothetical protein
VGPTAAHRRPRYGGRRESTAPPGSDLYYARRTTPTGAFGPRQAIVELNDPAFTDQDPWVSDDERHILWSSNRGGMNQLWEASR